MAKRRRPLKILYLDSSVLFSAVNSLTGGSAKLFTLSDFKLVVSTLVLTEVERNVRDKLQAYHLKRFFMLVSHLEVVESTPTVKQIQSAQQVTSTKDAPILASAKKAKTDGIVTLDKKHFLKPEVEDFIKPIKILTPAQLFEELKN